MMPMTNTPDTTASSGASSPSTPSNPPVAPVSVIVQAPANAPSAADASKPKGSRTAAPKAAEAQPVLRGTQVNHDPGTTLSPAAAGKTPDEIALAFLGVTEEAPLPQGQDEPETHEDEDDEQDEDSDLEEQPEVKAAVASVPADQPLEGIVKAMTEKGLGKLANRITKIFTENGELKAAVLQAKQAPPVVLEAPGQATPFAQAITAEQVEAQAKSLTSEVRTYLRWLGRHPEGGVYAEGTKHEMELTAAQVDSDITHYEEYLDDLPFQATKRKEWLTKYAEEIKSLAVPVDELIKPKVATRESKLLQNVPELARDAGFALFLADAQAGRELREKQAEGQVQVFVNAKVKATNNATGGKGRPEVAASRNTPGKTGEAPDLSALRERAAKGGRDAAEAQDQITMLFAGAA